MDRIQQAVDTCLAHAEGAERPFSQVRTFIDYLKADPTWTSQEIIEVQTNVVRALMHLQELHQHAH
jgi:hypothetical protein